MVEAETLAELDLSEDELHWVNQDQHEACRQLWASVVNQALKDAAFEGSVVRDDMAEFAGFEPGVFYRLSRGYKEALRHEYLCFLAIAANAWFEDKAKTPGSFRWICEVVGLDEQATLIAARALFEAGKAKYFH